jgi:hypothetical protein
VRSGFRDVARLRRDRFLTVDMPISMHVHAGRCRAERFQALPGWPNQLKPYLSCVDGPGCVHKRSEATQVSHGVTTA